MNPFKRPYARARHTPGVMNKQESKYAEGLEALRLTGEIRSWKYEPLKFRLADKTYYNPDFLVIQADGLVEFHEVKGHMEDDAAVKIKVAAEQFPMFKFIVVFRGGKRVEF